MQCRVFLHGLPVRCVRLVIARSAHRWVIRLELGIGVDEADRVRCWAAGLDGPDVGGVGGSSEPNEPEISKAHADMLYMANMGTTWATGLHWGGGGWAVGRASHCNVYNQLSCPSQARRRAVLLANCANSCAIQFCTLFTFLISYCL